MHKYMKACATATSENVIAYLPHIVLNMPVKAHRSTFCPFPALQWVHTSKTAFLWNCFSDVLLLLLLSSLPTLRCVIAHYSPVTLMATLMWIIASGKSPLRLPRGPVFFIYLFFHKQIIHNHRQIGVKHSAAPLPDLMCCYMWFNCPLCGGLMCGGCSHGYRRRFLGHVVIIQTL